MPSVAKGLLKFKLAASTLNLLTATTSTFTLVVMEMEEPVRSHSKEAQPTHSTHSPHREVTSQPSTLKLLTKATEIQMPTMLLYEGLSGDAQTVDLIRGSANSGFHGVQIVSAATGDYDGDGLSDLAEYEGVTSPIVADGDEDGLNDGAEVAAGTNPNNADSDADGVADGAEIAAGTDPLDADTDDDGYSDGDEIAKGSDPTDGSSVPGLPTPIAFYDFEGKSSAAIDRSYNDNTATVSGNITFVDEGAPSGSSPGAAASMNGGHFTCSWY